MITKIICSSGSSPYNVLSTIVEMTSPRSRRRLSRNERQRFNYRVRMLSMSPEQRQQHLHRRCLDYRACTSTSQATGVPVYTKLLIHHLPQQLIKGKYL